MATGASGLRIADIHKVNNDEFCIQNEELCSKNEELCI